MTITAIAETSTERIDRTAVALTTLEQGIQELTTSERWTDYLRAQATFHKYSFGNVLLLQAQTRDWIDPQTGLQRAPATRCAGFHAWHRLGRSVRKGERGLWVLAPITKRIKVDAQTDTDDEKTFERLVGFKAVSVFDVSQTEGKELPVIASRLQGDSDEQAVFNQLILLGIAHGFTTETVPQAELGQANGDAHFGMHRIRLSEELSGEMRLKTMAHELAHVLLQHQDPDRHRNEKELEAESTAFVVLHHLGVDAGQYSFGYVAGWAGGGKDAIEGIRLSGTRIQKAAHAIIAALERDDNDGRELADSRERFNDQRRGRDDDQRNAYRDGATRSWDF